LGFEIRLVHSKNLLHLKLGISNLAYSEIDSPHTSGTFCHEDMPLRLGVRMDSEYLARKLYGIAIEIGGLCSFAVDLFDR
jgi:hypothetical protein